MHALLMSRFGGSAGGVAMPTPPRCDDETLSRKLSWLLRHAATSKDVTMTAGGWVELDEVLKLMEFRRYTKSDILRVVQYNDKCRFSLRAVSSFDGSVVESRCPSSPSLRASQKQYKPSFPSLASLATSSSIFTKTQESSSKPTTATSSATTSPTEPAHHTAPLQTVQDAVAITSTTNTNSHRVTVDNTVTAVDKCTDTADSTDATNATNTALTAPAVVSINVVAPIAPPPTLVNVRELQDEFLLRSGIVIYIRATQGHSLNIVEPSAIWDHIRTPEEVPICLHGTFWRCWQSISTSGLRRMQRNAIHFATGLPGDNEVLSGMRKTAEVIIYLDVAKAMRDGIVFYRSENNVILSPGKEGVIAPKYFMRVVDIFMRVVDLHTSKVIM